MWGLWIIFDFTFIFLIFKKCFYKVLNYQKEISKFEREKACSDLLDGFNFMNSLPACNEMLILF